MKKKESCKILANRKFQNENFIGAKTTWEFNKDGSEINVKAGWLGINTVNTTVNVESLGDGKFVAKGFVSQEFTIEDNRINSGPVILDEI